MGNAFYHLCFQDPRWPLPGDKKASPIRSQGGSKKVILGQISVLGRAGPNAGPELLPALPQLGTDLGLFSALVPAHEGLDLGCVYAVIQSRGVS